MTKICYPFAFIALLALASVPLCAQTKMGKDFLIDVNSPFVYVNFDHIGPGTPRTWSEPRSRIWLRLRNNCRIAIVVRANGVPDDSPKDEVGLEYDVVANPAKRIVSFSYMPTPKTRTGIDERDEAAREHPQGGAAAESQNSGTSSDEIPRGYMEEVASL